MRLTPGSLDGTARAGSDPQRAGLARNVRA
jgi:hypothetical protein